MASDADPRRDDQDPRMRRPIPADSCPAWLCDALPAHADRPPQACAAPIVTVITGGGSR